MAFSIWSAVTGDPTHTSGWAPRAIADILGKPHDGGITSRKAGHGIHTNAAKKSFNLAGTRGGRPHASSDPFHACNDVNQAWKGLHQAFNELIEASNAALEASNDAFEA
jgi:hypothetical protein